MEKEFTRKFKVRVPKSNSSIAKSIGKLHSNESLDKSSNATEEGNAICERPMRETSILVDIKQKYANWLTFWWGSV